MAHEHQYMTELWWEGSTGEGYEHYDRAHRVIAPPASGRLFLSSDPAFRGDRDRMNPEQLLVLAASSCQLLSFLAVAARARIDVVRYTDDAEAIMPEEPRPMRITRITLRPVVTLGQSSAEVPDERLAQLTEIAHRECFIANSLLTEVIVEPTFVRP